MTQFGATVHMNLKRPFMTRREFVASSTGAVVASTFARRPLAFGESSQLARAPSRVIIDTDPGVDDALALLLAMRSPELKIEGITPVAGNVPLELTLPNTLRMVEIASRTDSCGRWR
jgi:Inosine-uridine preferring nucleoside hydrolase